LKKLPITYHPNYDIPVPKNHSFVGSKFSDLFTYLQEYYSPNLKVLTPSSASQEQ